MTTHRTGRPALVELIQQIKERTGLSYRALAARSNYDISLQQLHALATGSATKAPDYQQIAALAEALGVDEGTVTRAVFLEWYGWEPPGGAAPPDDLIPPDLTLEEREELRRVIQAWLAAKRPSVGRRDTSSRRAVSPRAKSPRPQR